VNYAKRPRMILRILIVQYSRHIQRAFKRTQLVNSNSRRFSVSVRLHHRAPWVVSRKIPGQEKRFCAWGLDDTESVPAAQREVLIIGTSGLWMALEITRICVINIYFWPLLKAMFKSLHYLLLSKSGRTSSWRPL